MSAYDPTEQDIVEALDRLVPNLANAYDQNSAAMGRLVGALESALDVAACAGHEATRAAAIRRGRAARDAYDRWREQTSEGA